MATIEKRGESYKITVSCGYGADGKQVRRRMTWTPSSDMSTRQIEKELERQKVLFEEECRGSFAGGGNIKFEAFAKQWFQEYAEIKLKTRTVDRYHQFEARTYPAIGHLRMDRITTRNIQKFMISLGKPGVNQLTGGKLSPKTLRNYLSFVSSVFDYAIAQGMLRDNPCRGVTLPSAPSKERDCYTLEEAQRFLDLLQGEPLKWRSFFMLAVYGGFRRGELFGLEWKDIDFNSGVITISRTSHYTKAKGIYTDTPKTKSSQRSLKMPECVIRILRQYRAEQNAERLKVGSQWFDSDRLFVGWNGKPLIPTSAANWLGRFFSRTGMRPVGIHSFRHLNASLLINSGVNVRTVSAVLGHSQTSTTLNIYAHAFAEAQAKATEAVAAALNFENDRAHA